MPTALLLIDVQQSFHHRPCWSENDLPAFLTHTNALVAGIRTEQCCETTTRHASDEGWAVDFVTDATLTFDMRTPGGALLTAAQIRERTATVLAGRFATLCTVPQALARASAARATEVPA